MMWDMDFGRLSNRDREEFTRLVNYLLSRTFVLRERLDTADRVVKINSDYRFIERNFELFQEYLRVAGWDLNKDNNYGVISLHNIYGSNRTRMDKNTTYVLYVLRLIYEEESEKLSLRKDIITTIGEVMNKMSSLGLITKKLSDKDMNAIFSLFKSYSIIDKVEGKWNEATTQIMIYPSILFIVTNEKIAAIYEMMTSMLDEETEEVAAE